MQWIFFAAQQPSLFDGTFIQLITSLGSMGAAITVLVLNQRQLKEQNERSEKQIDRLFGQLADIAHDKGTVLRENAVALTKLEGSIEALTDAVDRMGDKTGEHRIIPK